MKQDIHEGVGQTHHGNNKNVHAQRETNDEDVEPDETVILVQTEFDKILSDDADKEQVETTVDNEINALLTSIPDFVDVNPRGRDL
jgi:hypothetical protein